MNSSDNPNPYIVPGQPQYNPRSQSQTEADDWMSQVYPGYSDPTQTPMRPGDTSRPMQTPPPQQMNNNNGNFKQNYDLMQAAFQQQGQRQQQPAQPDNDAMIREFMQFMHQVQRAQQPPQLPPQQTKVTTPILEPITVPLTFDLVFNLTINLNIKHNGE